MAQPVENDPEGADETRPLLFSPTDAQCDPIRPFVPSHHIRRSWPWKYVVVTCIGLAVVSDIGEFLYFTPRVRLFESVVCTRHYLKEDPSIVNGDGSVPEHFCKVNPVQDKVAFVLGWQVFFDSIPAILLPIPYGYIADKNGRKWVLFLALIGYMLSFTLPLFLVRVLQAPLQYVWTSSLFFLIGGGPTTITTMINTIIADVVPRELSFNWQEYHILLPALYRFNCRVPCCSPHLCSDVSNLWIPLVAAVVFQGLGAVMTLIIPETLPIPTFEVANNAPDNPTMAIGTAGTNDKPMFDTKLKRWNWQIRQSFGPVTRDAAAAVLVFTFFISKVGRQITNILLQYVSDRYDWSLSKAGLILSLRSGVNIILFAIILPSVATFALSRTTAVFRDLWIAKASIVLLTLGALLLFLSTTPALMIVGLIVYTSGTGFAPVARSLVTHLVESHQANNTSDIGRLYALISIMEGIGNLVAGPGISWAFRIGLSLGKGWLGLPFGFTAILFAVISGIVFSIRI